MSTESSISDNNAQSDSLFQWQRISRFTPTVWTILFGTLVARTSYFMAWPFLIVLLYQDYQASAVMVGGMLAASAVVGSIAGLYSGYLSDKFGRKWGYFIWLLSGCWQLFRNWACDIVVAVFCSNYAVWLNEAND